MGRAQEKTDFYQEKGSKAAIFTPNTGVLVQNRNIFLPTFGFQNRAFAHFFWAFLGIVPQNFRHYSPKYNFAHFCKK